VSSSYHRGVYPSFAGNLENEQELSQAANLGNPVTIGGQYPRLDRIEKIVHAPKKWVFQAIGKDLPSPETTFEQREQAIDLVSDYLVINGLSDVSIDIRRYEPWEQWHRLQSNVEISPIWKYTGGSLNWLRYTLLPNRVFGIDRYDPFTNTLHLNSDRPLRSLYESASAKQYLLHRNRLGVGNYTMLQFAPAAPVIHNFRSSSDLLTYDRHERNRQFENELYPLTYSRVGTAVASEVISITPFSSELSWYEAGFGRLVGGITGRLAGEAVVRNSTKNQMPANATAPLSSVTVEENQKEKAR